MNKFIQLQEGTSINFSNIVTIRYVKDYEEIYCISNSGTAHRYKCDYNEYIELLSILEVI